MPDDAPNLSHPWPDDDRDYLPPDPKTAHQALLALARMTFHVSDEPSGWPDARAMLRRLAREALVAVEKENREVKTDAH